MKQWGGWLGSLLILAACGKPAEKPATASTERIPTQTLSEFQMQDIRDGKKSMDLLATVGRLYEDQKVAELEQPYVTFYKEGAESSKLKAPLGKVFTETHEMEAWGGVQLLSADGTTLDTERLHYDPRTRQITSTTTVHLVKPDSVTDGIGLVTDPELKKVKIGQQKVTFRKAPKK